MSKTLVKMMPSVKTLLAATNAVANQATQAATVRQTLTTASPVSVPIQPHFSLVDLALMSNPVLFLQTLAVTVASAKTL